MLEALNSKFLACKLHQAFKTSIEMFGGSPTHYRYLLQTEKLVEKRALKGKRAVNLSLGLNCTFGFIMSVVLAIMPLLFSIDVFTYALLGITMSMLMVGFWSLPSFDVLLSPINYPVVAHTPVSSRTYFLVKLTQVLTYAVALLASLNLLPAFSGIWTHPGDGAGHSFLFPIVYLPVVFMSGLFTIGVMTTFAGYLTKLYTKKRLRNIAQYAQFVFPALFPVIWILLPTLAKDFTKDQFFSILKWFYLFPSSWFAGAVSIALGQIEWPQIVRDLVLAGLAVVSTLLLVMFPLRSIAQGYSVYLSYLAESGGRKTSQLQVKTSLVARLFQSRATHAGFCLGAAYLRRDKRILYHFVSGLGSTVLYLVLLARGEGWFSLKSFMLSYAIGLSPGFSGMFFFLGSTFVASFILHAQYSEHWRASWMLTLAPLAAPRDVWRGVQATVLLYIVVPYTLLLLCVATILWGKLGLLYVLPGLIMLLCYIALLPKPPSGLPFSEDLIQNKFNPVQLLWAFGSYLAIGSLVGIQFLAYLLNPSVYIGVYAVIVVGGFIIFIYCFMKK